MFNFAFRVMHGFSNMTALKYKYQGSIKFYNQLPPAFLDLPFNSFETKVKASLCSKACINDFIDDKNSW